MAKIKRSDFQPSDGGQSIVDLFKQYLLVRKQRESFLKREEEVKKRISGMVEEFGDEDDRGHVYFSLPEDTGGFKSLKREKRESSRLNADVAEALLKSKDLYEVCTRTEVVIDEDAIMQAYFQGRLTEEDLDSMFTKKVTYAFVPQKS